MIRSNQKKLNRLNRFLDFCLVIIAYLFSAWLRIYVLNGYRKNMAFSRGILLAAVVYAAVLVLVLSAAGFYDMNRLKRSSWKLGVLIVGTTLTVLTASALLFVFRLMDFSRAILLMFYCTTILFIGGKYWLMRFALNHLRSRGYNIRHQVVIGNGAAAEQYRRDLEDEPGLGIRIDAFAAPENAESVIGTLREHRPDEAVIALDPEQHTLLPEMIRICEAENVGFLLVPFLSGLLPERPVIESVGHTRLVNMPKRAKKGGVGQGGKGNNEAGHGGMSIAAEEAAPEIRIIVAAHKPYWMPQDPMYLPVHAGREGKQDLGYTGDNTGDNISSKNDGFCELTALYWAWKNLTADYLGLVHYRRHFTAQRRTADRRDVLTAEQALSFLSKADVLVPTPRNYWIESNYSQYVHAHHAADLDLTRMILKEKYPSFLPYFDNVMKNTKGHRFNMFIMKREALDRYCTWLFDILFELERRLDISTYSKNDRRVFGFVAERLLDVWLEKEEVKYLEIPYLFLDKENWITKILDFLARKLKHIRKDK